MNGVFKRVILLLLSALILGGCYNRPVRHLASDASLLDVGVSTRQDVLTYLGEPDQQIALGNGAEKWVYTSEEHSLLKNAPLVGKYFGKPDRGMITVILENGKVAKCVYGAYDSQALDWAKDFDWEKKPK